MTRFVKFKSQEKLELTKPERLLSQASIERVYN